MAINSLQANLAIFTPSVSRMIKPADVPSLETLILGGDAVSSADIAQWVGKIRRINAYGPTECCIACIGRVIENNRARADDIGRAVGSTAWIVEPQNHDMLAAIGAVGESVIESPSLAREYLHDRNKTEKAFVCPKWLQKNGTASARRVYKTGDLVRYGPHGDIHVLGRKDTQGKLHGQRIEVGEIEHQISAHGLMRDCLVLLADVGPKVPALIAVVTFTSITSQYVQGNSMRLLDREQEDIPTQIIHVRDDMATRLPRYTIPTVWLAVNYFPLLPSGKLDKALPRAGCFQ